MSKNIKIGTDGPVMESVTIENADELKTQKVGDNGSVYLGKKYAGKQVTVAFRAHDETDDSDAEGSEN